MANVSVIVNRFTGGYKSVHHFKKILFVALLFILSMNASFAKPPKVLVFGKTTSFYHESIPDGMVAIQLLGKETGFDVDTTRDAAVFSSPYCPLYL